MKLSQKISHLRTKLKVWRKLRLTCVTQVSPAVIAFLLKKFATKTSRCKIDIIRFQINTPQAGAPVERFTSEVDNQSVSKMR